MNFLVACLLALVLAACGGGGSNDGCQNIDPSRTSALPGCGGSTSPGTGGTPTTEGTLTLAMTDSGGAPFNALTPAKGAKLTAVLKNAQGQAVANAVIAFTSTDPSAVFSPSSGTALTDSSGAASVQLAAGTVAGAFTITATYSATPTIKGTASYTVSFPTGNAPSIALSMTDTSGAATNALTPSKGAKLTALLKNSQGQAIANAVVAFTSTDSSAVFTPTSGSALTDANGMASVQLAAGTQAGAYTVTATYAASAPATKASANYTVSFAGSSESASTMALAMTDSSGAAFNALTPSKGASVSATLKNNQNLPIAGALVTFSSTDGTAVLNTPTALTDASGVARTQLGAGALAGAFTLNASYGSGSSSARASANYTVSLPGGSNAPTVVLAMLDNSGAAFNALTPTRPARLQATVRDNQGLAVPNAVVTFTSTDLSGVFSPATGTALTDASGVASVQLAAGSQAGAFTASAATTVSGSNLRVSSGYTVTFPVVSFSTMSFNPTSVPAGGNASITISLQSGGAPYTQPVAVSFTSSCVASGKATIGTPVVTQGGVAIASYTDKGCAATDTVTATAILPNATLSASGNVTVLPPSVGSIKFVGVDTANIALKGTGGPGRPESATVKFQLFDTNGSALSGRMVNFTFSDSGTTTTTGGLSLSPAAVVSAADGTVTTTVSNGVQPTSVRVVAKVANSNPPLTTVSSLLVVSNGVPDQAHFSLSTAIGNCEGWVIDQLCSTVKVILGDHFGNPVPDGTAVNFTAEGGNIGASCVTKDGLCTVPLYSANPRPTGGRVTIMAFALGEENLIDNNGNNTYDAGDTFLDKSPDIYRDDNENGRWDAGEACVGPNSNGLCTTAGDGVYNGVLRSPQQPSNQTLYVSSALVQQFSTSSANIAIAPATTISCSPGAAVDVVVLVSDLNGLMMPAGSTIKFETTNGGGTFPAGAIVPNVVLGVGQPLSIPTYNVTISCPLVDNPGRFIVTVTSPSGVQTSASRNID
ncbi:beta strand repeat-containing protein [Pseudoduganella sp. OTU4001]|uniref:beta strand repeat-containing protein n=1 Tax=Pseudoduganella sp. OTU4001 TaxID=3043854 RepID=UPI00313E534A